MQAYSCDINFTKLQKKLTPQTCLQQRFRNNIPEGVPIERKHRAVHQKQHGHRVLLQLHAQVTRWRRLHEQI